MNKPGEKSTGQNMHCILSGKSKYKGGNSSKVSHDQFKDFQTLSLDFRFLSYKLTPKDLLNIQNDFVVHFVLLAQVFKGSTG